MTRSLIALTSICMLAACGANAPTPQATAVGDPVPALDAEAQAALTPDGVVSALEEGNARFLAGQSLNRDLGAQVKATATGQYPSAVVLSCIDSRIPTEIVLDQGVGDIFNARVAGNFVDEALLGSMEFATKVAGAKVVVVMGHTSCGAVKGACDNVQLGHISSLVSAIKPSVDAVTGGGECTSKDAELVNKISHHNVERTIQEIRTRSKVMAELESAGTIKLVGAMYDVATGKVTFL